MKATPLTLENLNKKIKNLIKEGLDSYWVVAEISELKVNYSGHCYLELIQKNENTDRIVARSRATIWSNTFRMLQPYFESTTGHAFTSDIKVMLRVVAEFHEVYGLSLNVVDIEPTYTVGEIAVRKQKILEKLHREGVLDMNRDMELPFLTQRIAIISSKTAAGLGDFMDQLTNNTYGFKFYTKLFPAVMQGNEAEGSIISQLDQIFEHSELFDCVVIIRGGGASIDLECFNSYWLAYNITQFPIPVLTGIGHEQDDTVCDVVAHTRLKTPTAVAEFLIDQTLYIKEELDDCLNRLVSTSSEILKDKLQKLNNSGQRLQRIYSVHVKEEIKKINKLSYRYNSSAKTLIGQQKSKLIKASVGVESVSKNLIKAEQNTLRLLQNKLFNLKREQLASHKYKLDIFAEQLKLSDPKNILKKGYSITLLEGKSVKDASSLKSGDTIETRFYKGKKKSIIK